MHTWSSRGLALLVALVVSGIVALPGTAGASQYVEGISDQSLATWEGGYSDGGYFNSSFPNFVFSSWIGVPPSHIKYARYVVPWNIVDNSTSTCFTAFSNWYHEVLSAGLIPEVALWTYPRLYGAKQTCSPAGAPMLPRSTAEYAQYVGTASTALLKQFPAIKVLEAWNEPNLTGENPSVTAAAEYGAETARLCSGICTSVVGDLIDTNGMQSYEEQYVPLLTGFVGGDPGVWGIHPYGATNRKEVAPVTTFKAHLPGKGTSDSIYFTEVGAYYCQEKEGIEVHFTEAEQASAAEYLVTKLLPYANRAFYYELAYGHDGLTPCMKESDTALYAPTGSPARETARSAARVVFGPEGPPTVTSTLASSVGLTGATLNGTINPQGIANSEYYFQYGTTTSYGSTTGQVDLGPGLAATGVNTAIAGLSSGTVYHYRVVGVSYGMASYGTDQSFSTESEPATATSWAVYSPNTGAARAFYPDGSNLATSWEWNPGTGWVNAHLGGHMAPGTTATITFDTASLATGVYYQNWNGQLAWQQWTASAGWTGEQVLGGAVATGASPYVTDKPSNGQTTVYYEDKSGALAFWQWNPVAGWSNVIVGGHMAAGATPTATYNGATGAAGIYYQNASSQLAWQQWTSSGGWSGEQVLGGQMSPGAAPFVVDKPSNSQTTVYYEDKTGAMAFWQWNEVKGWNNVIVGGHMAAGTAPAVTLNISTGAAGVYYQNTSGQVAWQQWVPVNGWSGEQVLGGQVTPGTSPSVTDKPSNSQTTVYYRQSGGSVAYWQWNEVGGWTDTVP